MFNEDLEHGLLKEFNTELLLWHVKFENENNNLNNILEQFIEDLPES